LASVKHIMNCELPPVIPNSVYLDLKSFSFSDDNNNHPLTNSSKKDIFLSTCFVQPGITPKFTQEVLLHKVKLESCQINEKDMTVHGFIRVANLGFTKLVTVRHTSNNWLTFNDVLAQYVPNSVGGTDRFSFTLSIPKYFNAGNELLFAVFFQCQGVQFWDNNFGKNYEIKCFSKMDSTSEMRSEWLNRY